MTVSPYESSITAGFTALGEWAGVIEKLSPEIIAWIAAELPIHVQRVMDRRIRICKRFCRRERFSKALIMSQISIDFKDLTAEQQATISTLINYELNIK